MCSSFESSKQSASKTAHMFEIKYLSVPHLDRSSSSHHYAFQFYQQIPNLEDKSIRSLANHTRAHANSEKTQSRHPSCTWGCESSHASSVSLTCTSLTPNHSSRTGDNRICRMLCTISRHPALALTRNQPTASDVVAVVSVEVVGDMVVGPLIMVFAVCSEEEVAVDGVVYRGETVVGPTTSVLLFY